jgi:peptide deformylase
MTILPILIEPEPVLRKKAAPVAKVTRDVEALLDNMLATMYAAPGIGLAAPQVGVSQRLVTIDLGLRDEKAAPDKPVDVYKLINPEIIGVSEEQNVYEEGCLSIPGIYEEVTRPARIRVKFQTVAGKTEELDLDGLLATCFQHEIDHLNGILFIDYLSKLKRDMILRKMKKLKAEMPVRIPHDPTHDL